MPSTSAVPLQLRQPKWLDCPLCRQAHGAGHLRTVGASSFSWEPALCARAQIDISPLHARITANSRWGACSLWHCRAACQVWSSLGSLGPRSGLAHRAGLQQVCCTRELPQTPAGAPAPRGAAGLHAKSGAARAAWGRDQGPAPSETQHGYFRDRAALPSMRTLIGCHNDGQGTERVAAQQQLAWPRDAARSTSPRRSFSVRTIRHQGLDDAQTGPESAAARSRIP